MSETKYLDAGGQQDDYMNYVVKEGAKGAALGAAAVLPANWALARRYPAYRALPLPGKVFLSMMLIIPVGTVFAEKAGEHFIAENSLRVAATNYDELTREKMAAEERWNKLSTTEKIKDWSTRHQYRIVGGSWVASLGIAFGLVARNKYQTFPQKIVQARMYAQGLTVGVLIASAVLAGVNAKGEKPAAPVDHSWKDMLEQGGSLTKAERIALHTVRKAPTPAPPVEAAPATA